MNAKVARALTELQNKEDLSNLFDRIEKTAEKGDLSVTTELTDSQVICLRNLKYTVCCLPEAGTYTIIW